MNKRAVRYLIYVPKCVVFAAKQSTTM